MTIMTVWLCTFTAVFAAAALWNRFVVRERSRRARGGE